MMSSESSDQERLANIGVAERKQLTKLILPGKKGRAWACNDSGISNHDFNQAVSACDTVEDAPGAIAEPGRQRVRMLLPRRLPGQEVVSGMCARLIDPKKAQRESSKLRKGNSFCDIALHRFVDHLKVMPNNAGPVHIAVDSGRLCGWTSCWAVGQYG